MLALNKQPARVRSPFRVMTMLVLFVVSTMLITHTGCVSRGNGYDPAAAAQGGASILTTEQPITTTVQDAYYFFTDIFHGEH